MVKMSTLDGVGLTKGEVATTTVVVSPWATAALARSSKAGAEWAMDARARMVMMALAMAMAMAMATMTMVVQTRVANAMRPPWSRGAEQKTLPARPPASYKVGVLPGLAGAGAPEWWGRRPEIFAPSATA